MKDIFNPDSYTEKAMPISTALCRAIDDLGNLDEASNAVTECRKAYSEIYNKFFNSLTKEQQDLYRNVQRGDMEESALEIRESFNKGLRFGVLLMQELFGGNFSGTTNK